MPYIIDTRRGRGLVAMMLLGCFLLLAAPAAGADEAGAPAPCAAPAWKHPFTPWNDSGRYTLAPGADMESGTQDWSLSGGAAIVSGNEPFHVGGITDAHSLSVPAGASATSPVVCVAKDYPFFRFFARNAGNARAMLHVEVLYLGADGRLAAASVASLKHRSPLWQATPRISTNVGLTGSTSTADVVPVAFRFTADRAGGDWSVDDVYVDPWSRG